jgi:hypothetical protein
MNWKRWRVGLLVAAITGVCTTFTVGLIVPGMTRQEGLLILAASIAKDILLYLKSHPVDEVTDCQCTVPPAKT